MHKTICCCCDSGGAFFSVTYDEAVTLVNGSLLVNGAMYRISDRGDRGIYLTAISTTQFAREGVRRMLVPKTYASISIDGNDWLGIWNPNFVLDNVGQLSIWGGQVWSSVGTTDILPAIDDYTLNPAEWTLIPKDSFTNNEYIEMIFGVSYDFDNDWIERQWDGKGNVFGTTWIDQNNNYDTSHNFVDISDWNFSTINPSAENFMNNDCLGVYNNVISGRITDNILPRAYGGRIYDNIGNEIANNQNFGQIYNNTSSYIYNNRNDGTIEANTCAVYDNWNEGSITTNTCSGNIFRNRNIGAITNNSNIGVIQDNANTGGISNNAHDGFIYLNANNGYISNCVGSGGFSVFNNVNNGKIDNPATLGAGDIFDVTVNK